MSIKQVAKIIPWFPLSGIIFYIMIVVLWNLGIIPPPSDLVPLLEELYNKFGLIGVSITSFLEGVAYLGLYVPGTTIILLAIIFSEGSLLSILYLSIAITISLTLVSMLNYLFGMYFGGKRKQEPKKHGIEKNIFLSIIHPNLLAFYFFHRGYKKKEFWKVFLIPFAIFPYVFCVAYIISKFSNYFKAEVIGEPLYFLGALTLWFLVALTLENREYFGEGLRRIYKHLFHK